MSAQDDDRWGWEFVVEDFIVERLADDRRTAATLAGAERSAALARINVLAQVVTEHSIYVDDEKNWGRCSACEPVHGVPCRTIRLLSSLWADHPDAPRGPWRVTVADDLLAAGTYRRLAWGREPASDPERAAPD